MTTIPQPVWPWPLSEERLELLKQAKASLTDIDVLIVPVPWHPGSPGRPLCFGALPDAYTVTAPIRSENVDNVESIAAALRFALTAPANDPNYDEAHWLGAVMGCDVRYLYSEDEHGPVFFS